MNEQKETRYVDEYGNIKTGNIIITIIIGLLTIGLISSFLYRINTGEGVILTQVNGQKISIVETGWHTRTPLLTSLVSYSVVNNNIYFPSDYLELESKFQGDKQAGAIGFDIKTTDDKVVDVGAVMSFEITDLIQFGVKNTRPGEQMQKAFDALTFNYLQNQTSEKITGQITLVNKELFKQIKESQIESQFGISVNSFSLLRPTFTKVALDSLAEKQAIQAKSEGELNAAKNRAEAIKTIALAQKEQSDILKNIPQEQLDFNAKLTLYDTLKGNQNVIWVIPSNQPIVISK